jgi:hypothetical protein
VSGRSENTRISIHRAISRTQCRPRRVHVAINGRLWNPINRARPTVVPFRRDRWQRAMCRLRSFSDQIPHFSHADGAFSKQSLIKFGNAVELLEAKGSRKSASGSGKRNANCDARHRGSGHHPAADLNANVTAHGHKCAYNLFHKYIIASWTTRTTTSISAGNGLWSV